MSEDALNASARIWVWQGADGPASWHFVTFDGEVAEAISAHAAMRRLEEGRRRGFGSVKVEAQIGQTRWRTSLFPDNARDGYLLPLKKAVRVAESLVEGDDVAISLQLL